MMPSEPPPLPPGLPQGTSAGAGAGPALDDAGQRALDSLGAERDRRLHPMSWLFVLIAQLRQFALPLIVFVVFGRSASEDDLWFQAIGVLAAVLLTLGAVLRYFTYRFRIERGALVVRSGLLQRNLREIPLHRIQNVALKQGVLHRLLGVAEVRLESAVSAGTPEAQMQVLSLADAAALEAVVQACGRAETGAEPTSAASSEAPGEAAQVADPVLLELPLSEVVKLGLTSNRGLVVAAIGFGAFVQFGGDGFSKQIANTAEAGVNYAGSLELGWQAWLLGSLALLGMMVIAVRALAVLLVVLQYYGFRLVESGASLAVESGLLTRTRTRAPRHKIQRWTVHDSLLHRFFQRVSVRVETAVLQAVNEQQALTDLVPIAPPAEADALIRRWLPQIDWGHWQWRPLHPQAWRRILFPSLWLLLALAVFGAWRWGPSGLLPAVLLLPLAVLRARVLARRCGWVLTDHVLAWRSGWLSRHLSFAEVGRLQGLQLRQSPFDRRRGMASVYADTAGSGPLTHQLDLRYLPEDEARALFAELSRRVAADELEW